MRKSNLWERIYVYKREKLTLREIYQKHESQVEANQFYARIRIGWSIKKALETPPKLPKLYEFNGEYLTLKQIHAKYSPPVSLRLFENRIICEDWTIQKALESPATKAKTYIFKGEQLTLREIYYKENPEITLCAFKHRIRSGWDIEKALSKPALQYIRTNKKEKREVKKYDFKGESLTLKQIYNKYKPQISFACFDGRIRIGWDIEKALSTPQVWRKGGAA